MMICDMRYIRYIGNGDPQQEADYPAAQRRQEARRHQARQRGQLTRHARAHRRRRHVYAEGAQRGRASH